MVNLRIAVIGQKGGAGKTTIASNIATCAHLAGLRVGGLDLDEQGSLRDWSKARTKGSKLAGIGVERVKKPLDALEIARLSHGLNVTIMDGPPRLGDVTEAAAALADVIIVPVQSGAFDWWALARTFKDLDVGAGVRRKMKLKPSRLIFVLNRCNTSTRLGRDAVAAIGGIEGGELSPVMIGERVVYKSDALKGEGVASASPGSKAADEMAALWWFVSGGVS